MGSDLDFQHDASNQDLTPQRGPQCPSYVASSEREPRAELDTPWRRRGRRLSEERRRQHAAEVQRVHVIQQVVRLHVKLDAVSLVRVAAASDAAERIRAVAADDAHLRTLDAAGGPHAEADGPAHARANVGLRAPAAGIPSNA